jgi:hypothetical protein
VLPAEAKTSNLMCLTLKHALILYLWNSDQFRFLKQSSNHNRDLGAGDALIWRDGRIFSETADLHAGKSGGLL